MPSIVSVSLGAQPVAVIDVSAGGLLIESSRRLNPTEVSQLEIRRIDGSVSVRGRVVRSEVALIGEGAIQYRIAIAFDKPLEFIDDPAATDTVSTFAHVAALPLVIDPPDGIDQDRVNRW